MAKSDKRVKITLECTECKERNYITMKSKINDRERLEMKKFCSREHFEMRIHKRLIDIVEPNSKTIDSLQRIELPAGVDIEIKIQG